MRTERGNKIRRKRYSKGCMRFKKKNILMKDDISIQKKFLSVKIIQLVAFNTKMIAKKYTWSSSSIKVVSMRCGSGCIS